MSKPKIADLIERVEFEIQYRRLRGPSEVQRLRNLARIGAVAARLPGPVARRVDVALDRRIGQQDGPGVDRTGAVTTFHSGRSVGGCNADGNA